MKKLLVGILIFLTLLFSVLLYSRFLGVKGLKTNEIIIKDDIPSSYDGLKIVHFSDLHYKKVITEKEIKNLIKEIKKIKPDIVLFTGDLADDDYKLTNQDINFLIQELSKIETKSFDLTIPFTRSGFLRLKPYTEVQLYLPFVGNVVIDSPRLASTTNLHINFSRNNRSGEIGYQILAGGAEVGCYGGATAIPVPVGVSNITPQSLIASIHLTRK